MIKKVLFAFFLLFVVLSSSFASAATVNVNATIPTTDVLGCTDPAANNYDASATIDDGSCTYDGVPPIFGCTDPAASNYNPSAAIDDGSCTYDVLGCTDPAATNYNVSATVDDGSCVYGVLGCTDPAALNYNASATVDDGSCVYPVLGCTDPAANNYNPAATTDDGSCTYDVLGCTDPAALNYNPSANIDDGSCTYPLPGCTNPVADNYNPAATEDDGTCIISGCTNPVADNYDPTANNDDGTCVISGCTNPVATNYDPTANNDDGSCIILGCTNPVADNYDPIATDDDGTCIISGCTNPLATNYDATATVDDGSCILEGCTDPTAINYNPNATIDNGTCSYDPTDIPGCIDGSALNYNPVATVDDGSCVYPISGCTDSSALNYNPSASIENGSCVYQIVDIPDSGGGTIPPSQFEPRYFFYTNNNGLELTLGGFGNSNIDLLVGNDLSILISDEFPKEVDRISATISGQFIVFKYDSSMNQYIVKLTNFNSVGRVGVKLAVNYTDGSVQEKDITILVEPLGQVFSKFPEDRTRIFGIGVFLYDQNNNVVVGSNRINDNGTYGFMVPNGRYKLVVYDNGVEIYNSRFFNIRNNIVNRNIGLSLFEQIMEVVGEINEQVFDNPVVEETNKYAAPTVVTITSLSAIIAIPWWGFIHYIQLFFTEPLAWLFRRRRKGWGTVYDSITKKPIDLAVVRLYDKKTGRLIKSRVTDRQGRYHFLVSEGEYNIEVIKPNMIFPSQILMGRDEDKQYTGLYHGQVISIAKEQKGIITANIPVDPKDVVVSDREVLRKHFWYRIRKNISIIGPVFALISFTISPGLLMGSFTLVHLVLYLLFRRLAVQEQAKKWGVVLDAKTGKPVGGSVAKIYSPEYNKMLEAQVTDRHGRYGFLAGNNIYYIAASKEGYRTSKTDNIDLTRKKSEEVIGQDIKIHKLKAGEKPTEIKPETESGVAKEKDSSLDKKPEPGQKPEEKLAPEKEIIKEESPLAEMAEKIKESAQENKGKIEVDSSVDKSVDNVEKNEEHKNDNNDEIEESNDTPKESKFG